MAEGVGRPASGLTETGRLAALRDTGLSATADAGMDLFARLVVSVVGVPVALVSLVEPGQQVFPGMVGLAEPWAERRATPLSHSLCQHVVLSGEPLVLSDARADAQACANLAVTDLGVVGYAGMPLTDTDGHVLGSLCAIDTSPREWTEKELTDLTDLAAACSADLRLRIVSRHAEQARLQAQQAWHQADKLAAAARTALERSQLLQRASADLADSLGLAEVRMRVQDLVVGDLKPSYVGLVLLENGRLRRVADHEVAVAVEREHETYALTDAWPTARAVRENTMIVVHSADMDSGAYAQAATSAFRTLNLRTAACMPLPGTHRGLGVLVLAWDVPYELGLMERATLTALAGYTARAVERALFVDDRVAVARQLQEAMLTDLPTVDGLEIAALYHPAAADDMVGGDWYDAYPLPADGRTRVAITIGDITGHDMHAAAMMGQARSMLRQADLDHVGADPGHIVTAFCHANHALGTNVSGTLVHVHLEREPDGNWTFAWTNAGHPPPLLTHPDGTTEQLDEHDILIHPVFAGRPRATHRRTLTPGTTVLLYTDGLIEERGDLDAGIAHTAALLSANAGQPLPTLANDIVGAVAGTVLRDDIALIAIRITG